MTAAINGCASIIKGRNQNINIMTPDGENVDATIFSKSGMFETQLPRLVSIQKDHQDVTIRIKEDKCHQETVTVVKSKIEPWFWGNIFVGLFGSTTDSSTGAMWKYDSTVMLNPNRKTICSE